MRNKGISLLIPVLFLLMLALSLGAISAQAEDPSQVEFHSIRGSVTLRPYYNRTADRYELYLPGFLSPEDLQVSTPWYLSVSLPMEGSLPLEEDIPIKLSFLWGTRAGYTLRIYQCAAPQTIWIEAQDGVLEDIHADQSRQREVHVTITDAAGSSEYAGTSTMAGRGNGTWEWEKKPYDLTFSQPVSVGPFEDIDKLCLLAEYYDRSKLRNALSYHAARLLEFPYATEYAFADLYVNGEYLGLYGLATKREYEKHIQSDGIEAVFELSSSGKGQEISTDMGKLVRIRYGNEADIQYKVEQMETALLNRDWETLNRHINLQSWAEKYVLDEFLYNYDLSLTSQYFYLDASDQISCMLPWDYEWVLYPRLYPDAPEKEYALCANWNRDNWYMLLLEQEAFREKVLSILDTVYTPAFFRELEDYMALCQQQIQASWRCDQIRWAESYRSSHGAEPDSFPLEGHRQGFGDYFPLRRQVLEDIFENWEDQCLILFYSQVGEDFWEAPLQLILPRGSDLTAHHQQITAMSPTYPGCCFQGWFTPEGVPLEDISLVTEDLTLVAHYQPLA